MYYSWCVGSVFLDLSVNSPRPSVTSGLCPGGLPACLLLRAEWGREGTALLLLITSQPQHTGTGAPLAYATNPTTNHKQYLIINCACSAPSVWPASTAGRHVILLGLWLLGVTQSQW